jgi:tRNA-modifying protein YgfZ
LLGVAGPGATEALTEVFGRIPDRPMQTLRTSDDATLIHLGHSLYQLALPPQAAPDCWDRLARLAAPVGGLGWQWRLIQAGIPTITRATQDQFVPQMADMERVGAVSFHKGCYPGQEIVARAQYRGQVKRRLFRLHAQTDLAHAGQAVFRADDTATVGTVLNAAPAPGGGSDLLAVLLLDAADSTLTLGSPEGAALTRAG